MPSKAVKLSEDFVEIAREESEVMCRSIGAQIEYWARLGRRIESTGALGPARVRELLKGHGDVQDLTGSDDALYVDMLTQELEALDGSDTRVLDELRAGGHSVASTDENGRLLIEKPGTKVKRPPLRTVKQE